MTTKVNERIGFHYSLTGIQLCTLIFFGINYTPKSVLSKIKDKSTTYNIFRIQDDDSVICGFYGIAFIEYMLARKTLKDYTNLLFSKSL